MKTQLSLQALAGELERRRDAKRDYVVNTGSNLRMTATTGQIILEHPDQSTEIMPANEIAHNQIAARLEIPSRYYQRMLAESPELLSDNVNHWFKKNPESRMVRTLDGNVRAFLSNRYQRIDNDEIAKTVLPILADMPGLTIESCAITDGRMYIKAVTDKVQGEVTPGDVVQAGIAISNSEVGMGAVKIEPLIYRLVCSNGLIINDSKYSARHVGGRMTNEDRIRELLSDEALQADDKAILLKVRDVVKASFDPERFAQRISDMRDATQDKIEGNPAKAIEVLAKRAGILESEQSNILRHLVQGGDLSRWGLLNAVTRTAQDMEDYDRNTELETVGGQILYMPRSAWRDVAQAA